MADASPLDRLEALLRGAQGRGFGLLEYEEGAMRLRVTFAAGGTQGEAPRAPADAAPARPDGTPDAILSPGVGFLRCAHPAGERFPSEGEAVAAGTVVALIEAGPLLQPVAAGRAGRLGRRLVEEGCGVGFGTALFDFG